jgi:hypothetical protein
MVAIAIGIGLLWLGASPSQEKCPERGSSYMVEKVAEGRAVPEVVGAER